VPLQGGGASGSAALSGLSPETAAVEHYQSKLQRACSL
jgi:hypothetical protein